MSKPALIDKVLKTLDHRGVEAADNMRGVNVYVDDPSIKMESFFGIDGEVDLFIFNNPAPGTNVTSLANWEPGEDYLLYQNMNGAELAIAGPLYSDGTGFFGAWRPDADDSITIWGVPYQEANIEALFLPFDGVLGLHPEFFPYA